MDQNRHKVKRQRSNKRPESPPRGDEKTSAPQKPATWPSAGVPPGGGCNGRGREHTRARCCSQGRVQARARCCSQGRALRLLLRVSLLSHRVSPHVLQGPEAQRRPQLHVDGGHVEVDQILQSPSRVHNRIPRVTQLREHSDRRQREEERR